MAAAQLQEPPPAKPTHRQLQQQRKQLRRLKQYQEARQRRLEAEARAAEAAAAAKAAEAAAAAQAAVAAKAAAAARPPPAKKAKVPCSLPPPAHPTQRKLAEQSNFVVPQLVTARLLYVMHVPARRPSLPCSAHLQTVYRHARCNVPIRVMAALVSEPLMR